MNKYQEYLETMEAQEKQIWTRELWHKAMDEGTLAKMPTTVQQVEWYEEWYQIHPEEQAKIDQEIAEMNQGKASEYFAFKMFLRMFLEENGKDINDIFVLDYDRENKVCKVVHPLKQNKFYEFKL